MSHNIASHISTVVHHSFATCSVASHLHVRGAVDHDRVEDPPLRRGGGKVEGHRNALGMEGSEVARARGRAERPYPRNQGVPVIHNVSTRQT